MPSILARADANDLRGIISRQDCPLPVMRAILLRVPSVDVEYEDYECAKAMANLVREGLERHVLHDQLSMAGKWLKLYYNAIGVGLRLLLTVLPEDLLSIVDSYVSHAPSSSSPTAATSTRTSAAPNIV